MAAGDAIAAGEALLSTGVLLVRDNAVDRTVIVHPEPDDNAYLVAFSSAASALAWRSDVDMALVLGRGLFEEAHYQREHGVKLDPAGPTPVSMDMLQLKALLDGVPPGTEGRLSDPVGVQLAGSVFAARLRETMQGQRVSHGQVWLFERHVPTGEQPTLGLHGVARDDIDPLLAVLRKVTPAGMSFDVMEMSDEFRALLEDRLPDARVL